MTQANENAIAYWNGAAGAKWVANQDKMDRMYAGLVAPLMDAARLASGLQCLDVGCGCGDTTLALKQRVGSTGSVMAVDLSEPMLNRARARAREAGLEIRFVRSDVITHDFEPGSFDRIVSRFCVPLIEDPIKALRNLHGALAPDGQLTFLCWQGRANNPWLYITEDVLVSILAPDMPPPDPHAPSPFAFSSRERIHEVLTAGGFREIEIVDLPYAMSIEGSLDQGVAFYTERGPMGRIFRAADQATRERATRALCDAVARYHDGERLTMDGNTYMVHALP